MYVCMRVFVCVCVCVCLCVLKVGLALASSMLIIWSSPVLIGWPCFETFFAVLLFPTFLGPAWGSKYWASLLALSKMVRFPSDVAGVPDIFFAGFGS